MTGKFSRSTRRVRPRSSSMRPNSRFTPLPSLQTAASTRPASDGKIYRIDRNGTATTFFDPEEKYIWALASDAKGNLRGDRRKGAVYRITAGKGAPFYSTKATHATSLAVDKAGNLLVGTESPGRVVRVDADGKGFVLLDTAYQEVRTLRFDDKGVLFVAAANGRPNSGGVPSTPSDLSSQPTAGPSTGSPVPSVSVSTEITAVVVDSPSTGTGGNTTRPTPGVSKGAIYRIAPDGLWDMVWDAREDLPYDVAFDSDGRLIVATGDKGKIYRLEGNPIEATLLARASASQVTSLYRDSRGRIFYATANPGKISRLTAERAPRAPTSRVRDARGFVVGPSPRGVAGGAAKIEVSTRSGNVETPDDTERMVSACTTPVAHRQSQGTPCSVACGDDRSGEGPGAHFDNGGLSPAQPSPAGGPSGPSSGTVFQKP